MEVLKVGNINLLWSINYSTIVGGANLNEFDTWWFSNPEFLTSLPDLTWGSVCKFTIDHQTELKEKGFRFIDELCAVDPTRYNTLSVKAVDQDSRSSSHRASFLFGPSEEQVIYREYAGVSRGLSFPLGGRGSILQTHLSAYNTRASRRHALIHSEETLENFSGGGYEIQSWDHRPRFKFMTLKQQVTSTYFGLELEVNSKIPWSDMHHVMTEVEPKQEAFMYAKSDSSIGGSFIHDYEMVTHPMSPRRMRVEFKAFFKKLEILVTAKGFSMSDVLDMDTKTTGIHVHVSQEAFIGATQRYQGSHRKKFLMFWNMGNKSNVAFTSKLARRDISQNHYVSPASAYNGRTPAWCLSRRGRPDNRYSACGDTGATLEVRAYRGQPTWEAVKHAVETTEAALRFTEVAPISVFNRNLPQAFEKWLGKQNRNSYRTLKENLKCV